MLSKDFREFIESLNEHDVRYLVVGGYAVAFHGYPRYTKDLDIRIEMSQENAEKIMEALKAFGFASLDLNPRDFLESDHGIQLGYLPNRIDILTTLRSLKFADCYKTRIGSVKLKVAVLREFQPIEASDIDVSELERTESVSMRIATACKGSEALCTEPEFEKRIGIVPVFEPVHLNELSIQLSDDIFNHIRITRHILI